MASRCELYEATYNCNDSTDNFPVITTSVALQEPVDNSSLADLHLPFTGSGLDPTAPSLNKTLTLANYWAIEQSVESLLTGQITNDILVDGDGVFVTLDLTIKGSNILLWDFIGYQVNGSLVNITFPHDFSDKVEELLVNITVSMAKFRNPNPGDFYLFTGSPISAATTAVAEATITTFPTEYLYLSQRLWTIYGVSLGIVLAAVMLGGVMFALNGIDADLSFSQVLVTTRNETLDRLSRGCNLGGWTISHELIKTRVRFGELIAQGPEMRDVRHQFFGLENEIMPLKQG